MVAKPMDPARIHEEKLRQPVCPNQGQISVSPCQELIGLQEDGEAKIDGLERGVLLVGEEEVLRLEVAVDHATPVAELHERSRCPHPREVVVTVDERDIPREDVELLSTSEQKNQS
jgi:hypothetical protein